MPGIFDDPRHAQLTVVPAKGGEQRILSASLDRNCNPYPPVRVPAWDGDAIVFAVEDHGNNDLYRASADGSSCDAILRGVGVTGFDAAGGDFVYTASTPTTFSELYLAGEPITQLTAPFASRRELSEPERFTAVSKDGTEVEAWIVPPAGLEEGKRYPLLLNIHGGPYTQYTTKFFDEFQVLAGAGYAVAFCNPRGSSGYSEEWGRAIRGPGELGPGWGSVDYEDLIAVTDEAVSRFAFCDGERVGVLGGSYGGFMTSWIVGHTDRFQAACSERAVNNMIAEAGSSDIGVWFKGYTGSHWFEDPETHRKLSPSTYAQNVTTPLLIVHSEDDLRCPVVNAEELFSILRILGREVEFVRFPHGEGHELSRSGTPRHRVQRFEILVYWFDRYLMYSARARRTPLPWTRTPRSTASSRAPGCPSRRAAHTASTSRSSVPGSRRAAGMWTTSTSRCSPPTPPSSPPPGPVASRASSPRRPSRGSSPRYARSSASLSGRAASPTCRSPSAAAAGFRTRLLRARSSLCWRASTATDRYRFATGRCSSSSTRRGFARRRP